MDLGIAGRKALVCAASLGLGFACAMALARDGVELTIVARGRDALGQAAEAIRTRTGARVSAVTADITTAEGRLAALQACAQPDILVNNAGGPPPGDFREWSEDDWLRALNANMLGPIAMIKATLDGMIDRRFGRIVNITSSAVKSPVGLLGLSNGARAGLTGFVGGLARQVAQHNVTINNLLPGKFATDRLRANMAARAHVAGSTFDDEWQRHAAANPTRRYGDPAEFGEACAFLCSANASFIVGQNLLIDGGEFPGTL
jgi:3-oxoacyl-[acyl-carrier protein] reductase